MNEYKTCTKCKVEKHISCFYKRNNSTQSACKSCRREYNTRYYQRNKEWFSANRKEHYKKNKSQENERGKEYLKHYYQANKAKYREYNRSKKSRMRKATPYWLTEEQHQAIRDIYEYAEDCRLITGGSYHVDHIIPLRGTNVCGLHVPWNLQILPSDVNDSKGGKVDQTLALATEA